MTLTTWYKLICDFGLLLHESIIYITYVFFVKLYSLVHINHSCRAFIGGGNEKEEKREMILTFKGK